MANLTQGVDENQVKAHFQQFGEVKDFFFRGDRTSSRGGIVFVTYMDQRGMYTALGASEHVVDGVHLVVSEARPKPGQGDGSYNDPRGSSSRQENRVFVGRIPQHLTDEAIREYFNQFGRLEDFYKPRNQRSGADGMDFGFAIFATAQGMARVLSHTPHLIGPEQTELEIKRARPRPDQTERPQRGQGGHAGHDEHSDYAAEYAGHLSLVAYTFFSGSLFIVRSCAYICHRGINAWAPSS